MTGETTQPPMAWRYCGNQMKLWRTEAGVSREELAAEAGYGPETIKSMEQGRRRPTLRVLEIADDMCGAQGKLKAAYVYLQPDKAPARVQAFLDAEASAVVQHSYQPLLIPGLLQTEEYARALMSSQCPRVDRELIEQRVAIRLQRQRMLTEKPTALFTFVIYEAALRTPVGGPEAMRRQLHHLVEVGQLPGVSIHALLMSQGSHGWLNGPMLLLETAEHERYAYTESQGVSSLQAEVEVVSAYAQRYGMLQAQSLSAEDSAAYFRKLMQE
ncbi:helix-turn-helix transcriptional regulator [Streptomyces olivoreticuli]|uniref:helix-turn-helix domain-containing protein n=1 Tax=Streptomyces olivoreticuli TaxID=68246 RepID=UPI002658CB9C|nr:helix-turn-helix transcriptional regulator [Streptomyces olivoreticuli]WKK25827.1 helix-turn-helix transcriptional regulator [Streptomyces olivoreticuli]